MLTIWTITNQRTPPALDHLAQTNLDLHLPYSVIALLRINLTFQGLKNQLLLAILVGQLMRHRWSIDVSDATV